MTAVRPKTLNGRYQVFVDFLHGGNGILVNTYDQIGVAEKCVNALNAEVPGSFVSRAWFVDTDGVDRLVSGA